MAMKPARTARGLTGLMAAGLIMAAGAYSTAALGAADTKLLAGVSAADMVTILKEHKIAAQQAPMPSGEPLILAQIASGDKFLVRLQNCGQSGANCQIVQFSAIFSGANLPAADFNEFNGRYAFGKSYDDDKGVMYIEHAMSVAGGIPRPAVEVNMYIFFKTAELFSRFIQQRLSTVTASSRGAPRGIINPGGSLPGNSSLASIRSTAKRHPEIINRVKKGQVTKWPSPKRR